MRERHGRHTTGIAMDEPPVSTVFLPDDEDTIVDELFETHESSAGADVLSSAAPIPHMQVRRRCHSACAADSHCHD